MVMSLITLLNTIYRRNVKSTDSLTLNKCHSIVVNSYRHHTNDLLTRTSITNHERMTEQTRLTIHDYLTVTIDGSKRTRRVFIVNNVAT